MLFLIISDKTTIFDEHMKKKLANVQDAMYLLVAPRQILTVTSREGCAGGGGLGHKILSLVGVFTAELSA
jgi:hypothetical protein